MTMPVNDAYDADRARIELVIHGVRKSREHDSAKSAMHHRKALGVLRNLTKCTIDNRKEVSGGLR
jgi:hypothetical protein